MLGRAVDEKGKLKADADQQAAGLPKNLAEVVLFDVLNPDGFYGGQRDQAERWLTAQIRRRTRASRRSRAPTAMRISERVSASRHADLPEHPLRLPIGYGQLSTSQAPTHGDPAPNRTAGKPLVATSHTLVAMPT